MCGRILSRKQRILSHLITKHDKSPMKRVYKTYEDDPSVSVPKRTAYRRSAARNRLFSNIVDSGSETSDIELVNDLSDVGDLPIGPSEALNSTECEEDRNHYEHPTILLPIEQNTKTIQDASLPQDVLLDSSSNSGTSSISDSESSIDSDTESSTISDDCRSSEFSISAQSSSDSDNSPTVDEEIEHHYSETHVQILCIMSYILRHNLTGAAANDMLKLFPILCPSFNNGENLTYEKLVSNSGETHCKRIDYCLTCNSRFSDDPDVFVCGTNGCSVYRYKGPISAQMEKNRQPRSCFVIADVQKQLKYILERKDVWKHVQITKSRVQQNVEENTNIMDIVDGQYYRRLCEPGNFLHDAKSVSAVFNTDGIPLYNSSNVKLWPVFLAINELSPSTRFARENMVLASIWQGKNKPPFAQYMHSFAEEMKSLYEEGFPIKPPCVSVPFTVKLGVFLATMDLQAKGYVLNMTMHNGQYGCSTCEEEGKSVRQGKGYSRSYPYRGPEQKPDLRDSDDIKNVKGQNATNVKRIKGICGVTGLAAMPWFDLVLGIVPDYMHCVLLGVTKNLLYKFFSATNSGKPYFVGKQMKHIARRLQDICPPDYIERMPRDLEKNYNNFKATELQSWLLFYGIPCLNGFLKDEYLIRLSHLCEGIHLLLGDNITEEELQRAELHLETFYEQYATLYGEGSCGLNVHNIGAHMVFYVRMWGPLWAWSCFAFEDWNSALLQSVHGTGDVTKQCLRLKEIQLKLSSITIHSVQHQSAQIFLGKMKEHGRSWSCGKSYLTISVAGALHNATDLPEHILQAVLEETGADSVHSIKKALRVRFGEQKLYSQEYTRMKKRICYIVRCRNGDIRKIIYFAVNTQNNSICAVTQKLVVHDPSFICDTMPRHIIRVIESVEIDVLPIGVIVDKIFLMHVDGLAYIAFMPNMIGHSVFK